MMSRDGCALLVTLCVVLAFAEADAQSCSYAKKIYSDGSVVKMEEPCLTCSCVKGQLVCHLRMCPTLPDITRKGCRIEKLHEKCCPRITCDTNTTTSAFGKFIHTNQVGRKDDSFIEPEIKPPSADTRTNRGGCKVDESFFADGSALPSSVHCTNCYCLKGSVRCIKPKCHLNITGCKPEYNHQHACCPTHYDCSMLGVTTVDGHVTKPTVTRKVCFWKSQRYPDGTRIATNDPCRSCFCVRGTVKCTTQECAPPIEGCTPIRQKGYCCPLEYECEEDLESNSTVTEPPYPINSDILSSRIRGNDRVIDFPFDQLGNDYQLVKRTPSGRETPVETHRERVKGVKGLMRPTAKLPSEFLEDESNRQEKSHSESRKPTRSASSMHYFPPRGNNRRVMFSKRQRSSTTTESAIDEESQTDSTLELSSVSDAKPTVAPKVKSSYKPRRKTTTAAPTTRPATNSARQRKKTTTGNPSSQASTKGVTTMKTKITTKRDVPETTTTTPLAVVTEEITTVKVPLSTNQETGTMSEEHQEGYHVLDAGSYNEGYDDLHEESAFGIEWPGLAANVFDYFKEESHASRETAEVEEKSEEVGKEKEAGSNREVHAITQSTPSITTTVKSTTTTTPTTPTTTPTTTVPTTSRTTPTTTTTTTTTTSRTASTTTEAEELSSTIKISTTQTTESDSTSRKILKRTTAFHTASSPTTTQESTTTSIAHLNTTGEFNAADNKTTDYSLDTDIETDLPTTMPDSSESKTIFLRRVGLNFQVSQQKPQSGMNWTSRLIPEGHPASDAMYSKPGTATIQKLPHQEGRGSTRLLVTGEDNIQTSRSEKEASTKESSIIEGFDFPISEDSPAFQVIPFLPEDAVFKEQQSNKNKTSWQSISSLPEGNAPLATSKNDPVTISSNDISKTLRNDPNRSISRSSSEGSPRSESGAPTDSYLSRWIPIRHEDPLTYKKNEHNKNSSGLSSSKTSIESEEDDDSKPSLLGLLSLFGFSGLGGAKKTNTNNQSLISESSSPLPQIPVNHESNGWLPLRPGGDDTKPASGPTTEDHFLNQPLSTSALQMRLPNATGNMFLIGQPKEETLPIPMDHVDEQWDRKQAESKPTTTTEPILKLILSHIQNSSEILNASTTAKSVITTPEETTTLKLRHGIASTAEELITTTSPTMNNTNTNETNLRVEDAIAELLSNINNSNNNSNPTVPTAVPVNITTENQVPEETTPVSIWDLLNLFEPREPTTGVQYVPTTETPTFDRNNYSYFPLSDSYSYEPIENTNPSTSQSVVDKSIVLNESFNSDRFNEEKSSDNHKIDIPENEATGIYNPFILQVKGCDIYGKYYNMGEVVKELSSSCKQCVCSGFGVDCNRIC